MKEKDMEYTDDARRKELARAFDEWYYAPGQDIFHCGPSVSYMEGARYADEHPRSPWVSAEDATPTPCKPVLVAYYHLADEGRRKGYDTCMAFYNSGEWIAANVNAPNARINNKVTHWMEIPEAPGGNWQKA